MTHDAGDVLSGGGDRPELPHTSLDRALWALAGTGEFGSEELRPVVQRHVSELRRSGASIQATVISVKQALERAERAYFRDGPPSAERRRLSEQIVTWSIEAYYRSD